jgi:nickel/cobalt transporter (NicO) family protein
MKSLSSMLAAALFALMMPVCAALAQAPDKPASAFGHRPAQSSATQQATPAPVGPPSVLDTAWNWVLTQQSALNRKMAAAVKDLKTADPAHATLVLVMIAFAYGVLHAAGPGHGKAIISSYVLANDETVRRGIALSFLAALFQALSAITFVGVMSLILRQTSMQMRATEAMIESLSWALVALAGAWLLWRQARAHIPAFAGPGHDHGHHEHGHHEHTYSHNHHHGHGPECGCGHSHMPDPKQLAGAWSWSKAVPLALSVGIRPCSGAIILLIFAMSQGLLWAGILGTFAMALGTAITVSILATLAVGSRDLARRLSGPGSRWAERVTVAAGFTGAALVFLMGTAFFFASLKGGAPL